MEKTVFLLARVERNVMNLLEKTFKEIYSTSSCNTFLWLILQTYQTRGYKNWSVVGGILANCEKTFPQTVGVGGRMDCHWVRYRVLWELWQFSKAVSSLETYTVWVQGVVCKSSFPVPLWFWIYKGSTSRKTDLVKNFGLGAWVVLDQVDSVLNGEDGNHLISVIEVNNFFKSFRFIEECSKRNLQILGH